MSLPTRVYKYQPPTAQAITTASSSKLWFSNPTAFNDPYDCAVDMIDAAIGQSLRAITEPQCREFAQHCYDDLPESNRPADISKIHNANFFEIKHAVAHAIRASVAEALSSVGVCCFAGSCDNILMWSHYGDSHKGFCLEFDTSIEPFTDLVHIEYEDTFPLFDVDTFFSLKEAQLVSYLTTKAKCWEYESEWRLLNRSPNTPVEFNPKALTAIHFGAWMPVEQIKVIMRAVNNPGVEFYQIGQNTNSFKLIKSATRFEREKPANEPKS